MSDESATRSEGRISKRVIWRSLTNPSYGSFTMVEGVEAVD
jgi:hypothetical protein